MYRNSSHSKKCYRVSSARRSIGARALCATALLALSLSVVHAEEEGVKEGAKKVGHAAGTVVREIGQGAKKVGKTIGKAAKEGGKEFHRAVKGEQR